MFGQKKRSLSKSSVAAIPGCPCIAWTKESSSGTRTRGIASTGFCFISSFKYHNKSLSSIRYLVSLCCKDTSWLSLSNWSLTWPRKWSLFCADLSDSWSDMDLSARSMTESLTGAGHSLPVWNSG